VSLILSSNRFLADNNIAYFTNLQEGSQPQRLHAHGHVRAPGARQRASFGKRHLHLHRVAGVPFEHDESLRRRCGAGVPFDGSPRRRCGAGVPFVLVGSLRRQRGASRRGCTVRDAWIPRSHCGLNATCGTCTPFTGVLLHVYKTF
jgi:hypothetical protein